MSPHVATLQKIVESKSKNILTNQKAQSILDGLEKRSQGKETLHILSELEQMKTLPDWLRSALTINETFFFRHPTHFDYLREICRKTTALTRFNVLSIGCSTGEETYSVAMVFAEANLLATTQLTAYDLDPAAIEIARRGAYKSISEARTPSVFRALFKANTSTVRMGSQEQLVVKNDIRSRIKFSNENAFDAPLANYDIIFCRNILCYFREDQRAKLLERLVRKMKPGGHLFIGAGELFPRLPQLEPVRGQSSIAVVVSK